MSKPGADIWEGGGIPTGASRPGGNRRTPCSVGTLQGEAPFNGVSPGRSRRVGCGAPAFSLVEVVIAVGIFALAVSVILALLPGLGRQAVVSGDMLTAQRLPDALRLELARAAQAGDFDGLANAAAPMVAPLPATLQLVASRDATRVQTLNYQTPAAGDLLPESEQYFLAEVWRFTEPPLAFDPAGAGLALQVRVSWPYHTPGAAGPTPAAERDQLSFSLALRR